MVKDSRKFIRDDGVVFAWNPRLQGKPGLTLVDERDQPEEQVREEIFETVVPEPSDLEMLTKAQLVDKAVEVGAVVDMTMRKNDMIAKIEEVLI